MWGGSAPSSATSSRRSAGDSPAAGWRKGVRRRPPRQCHADPELALLAVGERGHRLVGHRPEAHAVEEIPGGGAGRVRRPWAQQAEAATGPPPHREKEILGDREPAAEER